MTFECIAGDSYWSGRSESNRAGWSPSNSRIRQLHPKTCRSGVSAGLDTVARAYGALRVTGLGAAGHSY